MKKEYLEERIKEIKDFLKNAENKDYLTEDLSRVP